jgi:hypothetical protein
MVCFDILIKTHKYIVCVWSIMCEYKTLGYVEYPLNLNGFQFTSGM